jgi:hypothetical protein
MGTKKEEIKVKTTRMKLIGMNIKSIHTTHLKTCQHISSFILPIGECFHQLLSTSVRALATPPTSFQTAIITITTIIEFNLIERKVRQREGASRDIYLGE